MDFVRVGPQPSALRNLSILPSCLGAVKTLTARILMSCALSLGLMSGSYATSISWVDSGPVTTDPFNIGFQDSGNGSVDIGIDLFNGTTWVNIYQATIPDGGTVFMSSISNINFAVMSVEGIRFTSSPPQNQTYHSFYDSSFCDGQCPTTFNFHDAVAQTPLPAALPLFAGGLGAFGLFAWRRKRKAAATA
jgi:hypothetical protein